MILSVEGILKPEQTLSDVLSEYSDVFEGFRTFLGTHKIKRKPDGVAVGNPSPTEFIPPHPTQNSSAVVLSDKLQKELKRIEDLGVTVRVSEPIDWVNSIATEKSSAQALCEYVSTPEI